MDLKSIVQAAEQIARDKSIEVGKVYEAIEGALAAAYKKEQSDKGAVIRAKLDPASGDVQFTRVKEVVDESTVRIVPEGEEVEEFAPAETAEGEEERLPRYNAERHILINEAKKIKKDVKLGDEVIFSMPATNDFGRIATQAAKQRIIQMLRKAEHDSVTAEFKNKEGQIVSGVIQRFDRGNVYVDLGRAIALMPRNEAIPGEHYLANERLRFYILSVGADSEGRSSGILLSRSHPKFVAELFRTEVPEIADGAVVIKNIAREAGSRTKIAVASNSPGVDAVGSCVGQRGTRVMTVTNELGMEKIDIIEWSAKPEDFIASALAPAKSKGVEILNAKEARVLVQDDQLSLAIGKGGQNVRLAAKLTGWKIDVRPASNPDKAQEGGIAVAVEVSDEGNSEIVPKAGAVESDQKPIYHKPEDDE